MLIAAWVVEAETVYIYLRDEYPGIREVLLKEIAKVEVAGLDRVTKIELRRGAGAYICGEESAMIESIEGKRDCRVTGRPMCAGRYLRPADPGEQCGDVVLGSRHCRERRRLVR